MNIVSREIVVVWLLIFLLFAGAFFGLYRIRQETEALRTQINTVAVRTDIDARRVGNQLATTEDLARDIENREVAFQSAIETISGRIGSAEAGNQQIAARLDSLENRVAGVEQGNPPLTDRMSALEGRIASVEMVNGQSSTPESDSQRIAALSDSLESRVGGIEQSNASFAERTEAFRACSHYVERRR